MAQSGLERVLGGSWLGSEFHMSNYVETVCFESVPLFFLFRGSWLWELAAVTGAFNTCLV